MMANLYAACLVSVLAMTVIFLVLSILIGVVKVLVYFLPYKEEEGPPETRQISAPDTLEEEHTAAIHAAIASHLGKLPHEIQIASIKPI